MASLKEERYYKMFKDALDFHADKFDEYQESAAYYELTQDSLRTMAVKPWIYQINTPFATDAINLRVASLQANDYSGELEPLSPDDVDTVLNLNKVYKEIWKASDHDRIVSEAVTQAAVLGEAYAHTIFNSDMITGGTNRKNKGHIETYLIDAASVHIDPKALHIRDADYIVVSERMTKNEVERKYPSFTIPEPKSSFGDTSPQDRGEIYADSKYETGENDKDIFTKITLYIKNKEGTIDKVEMLERKLISETKLPIRVFPISQLLWQKRLKSPYGTSLMSQLLPLQKVLNEIESANANANMQYSSPSYVISELSGIDPEAFAASAGAPAVVYQVSAGVDIDKAVRPLIPQRGIDEGLVITKQELERSIYKLAGINEAFQGVTGSAGNTATGSDMTIERAKMIEQRILVNIEDFVKQISTVIVEFILNGFEGETIYSRGEKTTTGDWDFQAYEIPEGASDMDYNFYIELNVRTNYSKEQQKQALMDLWQFENQYMNPNDVKAINTLDVIKTLNIPQQEEIQERYTQAVKMDAESKAQLISEMIDAARDLGIDSELLNAAIVELITNQLETPMLDEFMRTIELMQAEQEQQVQSLLNLRNQQASREAQMFEQEQEQLGGMELSALGDGFDTGDAELSTEGGETDPGDIELSIENT